MVSGDGRGLTCHSAATTGAPPDRARTLASGEFQGMLACLPRLPVCVSFAGNMHHVCRKLFPCVIRGAIGPPGTQP